MFEDPVSRSRLGRTNPKVAVVYPIQFGEEGLFGGGERYALELARALSKKTPTRLVTFGPESRRVRSGELEIHTHRPITYLRGQRTNPVSLGFLRSLWGVDVVHCVFWNSLLTDFATLFPRLLGKRIFVTDVGGGGSFSLLRWLPIGHLVDRYLLIAEQGGGAFKEFKDKWGIIYAGIDTDYYKPRDDLKREGVLFVGRLLPHKGVNYLIEGVQPDTKLTIVGRPYHEEYFRLLQKLSVGKRVTFVTEATNEDVVRHYQSSAVKVFCSVNDTVYGDHTDLPELLGFTAMEAMACGTPVIATKVGGMSEVVLDGVTGYLIPPNDPEAIREKIRILLGDSSLRERLSGAGRARILRHFTWESVAEKCINAYLGAGLNKEHGEQVALSAE
jgi:glycosyltransferase involved in cell wall biosynthesis